MRYGYLREDLPVSPRVVDVSDRVLPSIERDEHPSEPIRELGSTRNSGARAGPARGIIELTNDPSTPAQKRQKLNDSTDSGRVPLSAAEHVSTPQDFARPTRRYIEVRSPPLPQSGLQPVPRSAEPLRVRHLQEPEYLSRSLPSQSFVESRQPLTVHDRGDGRPPPLFSVPSTSASSQLHRPTAYAPDTASTYSLRDVPLSYSSANNSAFHSNQSTFAGDHRTSGQKRPRAELEYQVPQPASQGSYRVEYVSAHGPNYSQFQMYKPSASHENYDPRDPSIRTQTSQRVVYVHDVPLATQFSGARVSGETNRR